MSAPRVTYTLHSVAFPQVPLHERIVNDVSISFGREGEWEHAEFVVSWYDPSIFGGKTTLKVGFFGESLHALDHPVVQALIAGIRKARDGDIDPSPETVVEILDAAGAHPTHYHLRGLAERATTVEERAALQKRYEAAKRAEDE